jgi:predicted GNAT family acetyltransferase
LHAEFQSKRRTSVAREAVERMLDDAKAGVAFVGPSCPRSSRAFTQRRAGDVVRKLHALGCIILPSRRETA